MWLLCDWRGVGMRGGLEGGGEGLDACCVTAGGRDGYGDKKAGGEDTGLDRVRHDVAPRQIT
jgi:hypothetical protein